MKGGDTDVRFYNQDALNIIYKSCATLGLVALVYNVLLYFDIVNRPSLYVDWASVIIGITFSVSGVAVSIFKPHTKMQILLLCLGYYIMWTLNVLLSIGNATVSYVFGLMVLIATDILHGPKVMSVGCLYLPILMLSALAVSGNASNTHALTGMATASVLTICTAFFIAWLNSTNSIRISAYEQLKSRERIQRDRLATVINNISDAIISVTKNGIVRLYNAATLSLLDTNIALNGKRIDSVLNLVDTSGDPVKISDIINQRHTVEREDLMHVFEDGQKINLYISCSPVRSSYGNEGNNNSGTIVVLRDVTKARTLDEERDEFISVVSHELRTPVTIAEGALSNLQLLIQKQVTDPRLLTGATDSAHEQVLFLAKMINDLSTLSRAERGVGSETEVIDIRELANHMFKSYHGDAENKGLRMDIDMQNVTGQIKTSRLYIEEMLQNFITNAIKYTTEGSVTLQVVETSGKVTFSISDTGIGISHTDQKRIFDKFYRSEDYRTRETSGTGLGLYVAAKLARKLNTNINFSSKINHGSTFSFSMPLYVKPKQD
jgi:signal transduction histidine kinase